MSALIVSVGDGMEQETKELADHFPNASHVSSYSTGNFDVAFKFADQKSGCASFHTRDTPEGFRLIEVSAHENTGNLRVRFKPGSE